MQINSDRKASKCGSLILDLKHTYTDIKFVNLKFVNLLMSTLGIIMGKSSESLLLMLNDLDLDKTAQKHVIKKSLTLPLDVAISLFVVATNLGLTPNCQTFDLFCI